MAVQVENKTIIMIRCLRVRLTLLFLLLLMILRGNVPDLSRGGLIRAQIREYEFNYIAWELDALFQKAKQSLLGYQAFIPGDTGKTIVLDYLDIVGQILGLEWQIEAIYADPTVPDPGRASGELQRQRDDLERRRRELQPLAEPIIERQVATILQEEGFGARGQILPPVSFRFVQPPDVLVVSPRDTIRQDFAISIKPVAVQDRAIIEARVMAVSPQDSAYVTGIGGVGIWPAMIVQTRYPAIAFEVVAHEWSHHYLFFFPLGLEYLVLPETRIINETTATVFGNAVALKVLRRFYADEVAQELIWVPDYPTLADFHGNDRSPVSDPDVVPVYETISVRRAADYLLQQDHSAAAQRILDVWQQDARLPGNGITDDLDLPTPDSPSVEINRTRITVDYLLAIGYIEGAEAFMENRRQLLGMRVLNQAWFAFNGGYQADPGAGGGVSLGPVVDVTDPAFVGDLTGPVIHEMLLLAPDLESFLVMMRNITTRQELVSALIEARQRWGN